MTAAAPVRVKVCGITRIDDARIAVGLGASAIGLVLWASSPRAVSPDAARDIVAALPGHVVPVGVFVNESPARVDEIAREVGLGAVQLHGDEHVEDYLGLSRPVIRAVSPADDNEEAWVTRLPDDVVVLVDAHDPSRRGGTGRRADWERAARLAARRPIFLAGGLSADNVGEAIARVRPYGVDVSSGVEREPGIKDAAKLQAFFEAVTRAEAGLATTPVHREVS